MSASKDVSSVPPIDSGTRVSGEAAPETGRRPARMLPGWLEEGLMLLLVIWLFPLAILLVGAPVALLVRLLMAIAKTM
jgi:hypothetical protein